MSRNIEPLHTAEALSRYLTRYPAEITFGDQPAEHVFDRYHAEDYVMINDGTEFDRQRLLDHIRPTRQRAEAVSVDVHDAVVDGDRVAARYVLTADMRTGDRVVIEIAMFGRVGADGRLERVEQLTRPR